MNPFISICVPAFKRTGFLKRLLDSITSQSFQDFEVIVTDDSPTSEVADLCNQYAKQFQLHYFKNAQSLGTPENWNQSMRMAKGKWIKLMHDDDWFSSQDSLQAFASCINGNPDVEFFFSAFCNINETGGKSKKVSLNRFNANRLRHWPTALMNSNVIGPPSVTCHRNDPRLYYDKNLKWLVDIDFYVRYLMEKKFMYIDSVLVNIGINNEQVTQSSFQVAAVEIPENFYVLNKVGVAQLKNIVVFDAWWRLIRNLKITTIEMIRINGYSGEVPATIKRIINIQKKIPGFILRNGFFSKLIMSICFLLNW